jgi:osmotically-inducible protein OsmY
MPGLLVACPFEARSRRYETTTSGSVMSALLPRLSHRRLADEQLSQAVSKAVRARCGFGIRGLTVEVQEGTAVLGGTISSFYGKQLMLHAARQVDGVRQIVDEVGVVSG